MDQKEVLKALRRLKVETGSLACLGCGHENSCSTKGCAVIRAAIEALEQMHSTEPLTPEEIKAIDYARVWISYGESGEWGIVVNGLLYSIDTLEGAGFVDMLQDAVQGEDVTIPTGSYKLYWLPPKGGNAMGDYILRSAAIAAIEHEREDVREAAREMGCLGAEHDKYIATLSLDHVRKRVEQLPTVDV